MTTEILPAGQPAEPSPGPSVAEAPPRKKRRGWLVALIVVGILVLLGLIAFLVADGIAKDYARDYVRARVIEVLQLPEETDVDVDLGGGSIILQALAGRIQSVDVTVPELSFGDLTGAAELHAEGVPLDELEPVDVLRVDFSVDEGDLASIAGSLSGLELESIELDDPDIVVASAFSVFGLPLPVGMSLTPSAAEGQLVFTPLSVTVAESTFTAEQLLNDPLFGFLARDLLKQQSVCVAGSLPQALVLTDAAVEGDALVLSITGDGAALGGPELATLGVCAG
ncbi:DUF2993 domain-containing protein [Pseudolysinimonas sp.]|uniref:LmeA family phospholipid-binding protein n=1 Tax=Pseudolysinimonas sp. TaxID=2680009 RepID=UPI00286C9037|nr:DUF2993 domain-containing protein [Pseudolysinimonas sp.]